MAANNVGLLTDTMNGMSSQYDRQLKSEDVALQPVIDELHCVTVQRRTTKRSTTKFCRFIRTHTTLTIGRVVPAAPCKDELLFY